jgi:hypothetical protein
MGERTARVDAIRGRDRQDSRSLRVLTVLPLPPILPVQPQNLYPRPNVIPLVLSGDALSVESAAIRE